MQRRPATKPRCRTVSSTFSTRARVGALRKPGVDLVTGSDPACTDRSGDTPACRARRRRDAGSRSCADDH